MSAPTNTSLPTISYPGQAANAPMVGQTLSCDVGTWTGTDPIGYTYQWQCVNPNVSGPATPTWTLPITTIGGLVRCVVTAINSSGSTAAATAATSAIVAATAAIVPENTVSPIISGEPAPGKPLECSAGVWIGPAATFTYQWQQKIAGVWVNIDGENASTHAIATADVGTVVRCVVVATNTNGSSVAASASVTIITAGAYGAAQTPVASMQRQHRGTKWFRDIDGIWDAEKQFEGIETDVQDWSDALGGETITGIVVATDGIIINSSSNTDTTTTVTVTGVGAYHIDITTSAGRMVREYFRYRRLHRPLLGIMDGGGGIDADYR